MTDIAVTGPNPVWVSPAEQADALADALAALGFSCEVWRARDYMQHPCIVIKCGPKIHLRYVEHVFVGPNPHDDGEWWYWRVSPEDPLAMEKITPVSQPSAAADLLVRTLPQVAS